MDPDSAGGVPYPDPSPERLNSKQKRRNGKSVISALESLQRKIEMKYIISFQLTN